MMAEFPGYTRLKGAETLAIGSFAVTSPLRYKQWHELLVMAASAKSWVTQQQVKAYVNFGRWVADCYWCKKGMLTRPDWGIAYCATCGAQYEKGSVIFPEDPEVERALLARPDPDTQHWDDKQTAADLWRENQEELHLAR